MQFNTLRRTSFTSLSDLADFIVLNKMLITPIAITVNSMYLLWHLKVTRYQ